MLKKEAWPSYLLLTYSMYCTVHLVQTFSYKSQELNIFTFSYTQPTDAKPIYSIKEALLDLSMALQFAEQCHQRN